MKKSFYLLILFGFISIFFDVNSAMAQEILPALTTTPAANGGTTYSLTIETLLFMTALTFIPAALLLMTSFTRIIVVLSLLKSALGTQSTPPAQILLSLALFLTFFIMGPTFDKVYKEAYRTFSQGEISIMEAGERGAKPMKAFMLSQTRESDLAIFMNVANIKQLASPEETPLRVLVPAYVISELKTAFQIGFIVYLPFLIIDMVVASLLMSMGMMMMSPVMVALPFKIMLFVLVDGWHLIIAALVKSFTI